MSANRQSARTDARAYVPVVGRIALVVACVAAGAYMVRGFGRLYSEWREATQPRATLHVAATHFESMAAVLPLAGPWTFADLDWNLRSRTIRPTDLDARLESLAKTTVGDATALPELSQDIRDYVAKLQIEPCDRGRNQVYLLNKPDFKAQLVTCMANGSTRAVAFSVAYPQGADQWQVLELTPRSADSTRELGAAHLLPLPPSTRRSGGRFADDGTLLMEFVSLESKVDDLLAQWKNAGWEVRPTGLGGPDNFSYLCARDNEVIYAWSADGRGALQNLMLVRTPTSSNTKL